MRLTITSLQHARLLQEILNLLLLKLLKLAYLILLLLLLLLQILFLLLVLLLRMLLLQINLNILSSLNLLGNSLMKQIFMLD